MRIASVEHALPSGRTVRGGMFDRLLERSAVAAGFAAAMDKAGAFAAGKAATLALASRNLLRNMRRSMATLFAIAIGSVAILLYGGYNKNIEYSLQTAYVTSGGHIQIQHEDFFVHGGGDPTAYAVADHEALVSAIEADEELAGMVRVATPTLQFGGVAGNYEARVSRAVIGNGLVAGDHARMREWNDYGVQPIYPPFDLDPSPDAAVVGLGLSRVLQLCEALRVPECGRPTAPRAGKGAGGRAGSGGGEGEGKAALPDDIVKLVGQGEAAGPAKAERQQRIELLASSTHGAPNVVSVKVDRAESQGFKPLDDVYVLMHLPQAQQLVYGKETPKVTSIMVQLNHSSQIPAALARLKTLVAERFPEQHLAVLDFQTLNPYYVQSNRMFDAIFGFIFALISGIVLFTVFNTMNTAVVERTIEVGTLRAMGMRRSGIRAMFVLEGALLGCFGAALGVVSALLIAALVNRMGMTWTPPGISQDLPVTLKVWGEVGMIATTSAGLAAIATLSAWLPAYQAAKKPLVDALKHA